MKSPASPSNKESVVGFGNLKDRVTLLFKNPSRERNLIYLKTSKDGFHFTPVRRKINVGYFEKKKINNNFCSDFRLTSSRNDYFMTFLYKKGTKHSLICATARNMLSWNIVGEIPSIQEPGIIIPIDSDDRYYLAYHGNLEIKGAFSRDFRTWNFFNAPVVSPRIDFFDYSLTRLIGIIQTPKGILILYDCSYEDDDRVNLQVGGALISFINNDQVIWRSEVPLWTCNNSKTVPPELNIFGACLSGDNIILFFTNPTGEVFNVPIPADFVEKELFPIKETLQLERFEMNPIITKKPENEWESEATFNPAALYSEGKVHIFYRAIGRDGLSAFGYASTKDGVTINERLEKPAYYPRMEFEGIRTNPLDNPCQFEYRYFSGGGFGGCEDPKLVEIGERIYLTYVAFDGCNPPRVAISSIEKKDFLEKNWKWDLPKLISRPGVITKSACLLPEKIGGKYVIFHRVFPDILIDFVDNFEFGENRWLEGKKRISPRMFYWDSRKISIGAPPIKTEKGWLAIYHGVDDRDLCYRYCIGAMLLDINDPSRVICRSNCPLLIPTEPYENYWKSGILYPGGAVILNGQLLVYYGAGDSSVCVAMANLEELLSVLTKEKEVSFNIYKVNLD